jgi:hypothetical protein
MPGGKAANRSTSAAEASTRWPMSRQACCRRAAVFMVSPRNAISILMVPSSPMTHGPAMKRGAEVCPEAEVANVGVGAFVQLLQRVEASADEVNWRWRAECSSQRNRTGREARASSGSNCSAAPIQKAPVSEQIGLPAHNVRQPVMRSSLVASEGLELPMHPSWPVPA